MPAGIPDGTLLTYVGTWPTLDILSASPSDVISQVTDSLSQVGIVVISSKTDLGFLATLTIGASYQVTLQLQVENGQGFGAAADVISLVRHALFVAIGEFPISDSIPQIGQQSTLPTAAPPPSGASAADSISSFFSNLSTTGGISIGLVGLGIILAVLLIFRFGRAQ